MAAIRIPAFIRRLLVVIVIAAASSYVGGPSDLEQFIRGFYFSIAYTTVMWAGNGAIANYTRQKLPSVDDTNKRIGLQFLLGTLFTITAAVLLDYLLCMAIHGYWKHSSSVGGSVRTSLIMVYIVTAIWEAAYYFDLYKDAVKKANELQQANLENQLSRLKAELNPHFLFNNFNTLAGVIEEDPTKATQMVEALSKYYRYILKAESALLATLEEELESLEAYSFLLKIRHEEAFLLRKEISFECLAYQLPPLTLQTLAENATKHNAVRLSEPLELVIRCTSLGHLEVSNNMVARHGVAPGAGIGLSNLKERCRLLGLGDLHYGTVNKGQTFLVEIPMKRMVTQEVNNIENDERIAA